jgi:hypothetical protein
LKLTATSDYDMKNMSIVKHVGPSSVYPLLAIGANLDFLLNNHPTTWSTSAEFQKMKAVVSSLKVVNAPSGVPSPISLSIYKKNTRENN